MTTDVVPILRVADAAAAVVWYRRLGFEQQFEHRFEPHLPAYVGIRREGAQIHLSEHAGDATPNTLVYMWVDEIDPIAAEFGVTVSDAPWGVRSNSTTSTGIGCESLSRLPTDPTVRNTAVGHGDDLQQVIVGVGEVDATTTVVMVDLSRDLPPGSAQCSIPPSRIRPKMASNSASSTRNA